ncbi:MAG: hypothetical protein QXK98_02830 [Candidatus Bathyarchaeia archaeon]
MKLTKSKAGDMMKEKVMLTFTAAVILALMLASASLTKAAPSLDIYGYVDKTYYKPGESGTLKFWIYNSSPDGAILKNVTIEYPWYSPVWGGNQTITIANVVISQGENYSATDTFKIPDDSRAVGGAIRFRVYYEFGGNIYSHQDSVPLSVVVPYPAVLQDMDDLVTLFTILVVLTIVCTIILAATIFLSARRPQVVWKAEEKAE